MDISKQNIFLCLLFELDFNLNEELILNMQNHNADTPYLCAECDKWYIYIYI